MKTYADNLREQEKKRILKLHRRAIILLFIIAFCFIRAVFSFVLVNSKITITAHRGSTNIAPENTTASILEAIALNCEYIEIDVQLSKDNEVILLHDRTFARVGNVDSAPHDLYYDEIQKINVGQYKNSAIHISAPLLADIIDICKFTNTKLNIELKDYGHNQELPKRVVAIIEDKEFVNNCVITSFSPWMLKMVKALNPNIKIGLITSSSNLIMYYQATYADFFSINYMALTQTISIYLKRIGKEIFCWTPSNKLDITLAIYSGADNIITNNVPLAQLLTFSKTAIP